MSAASALVLKCLFDQGRIPGCPIIIGAPAIDVKVGTLEVKVGMPEMTVGTSDVKVDDAMLDLGFSNLFALLPMWAP